MAIRTITPPAPAPRFTLTCSSRACRAGLEYGEEDVQLEDPGGALRAFIICPHCKTSNAHVPLVQLDEAPVA